MTDRKLTMGVIVGNRGFFPGALCKKGREDIIAAVERAGMDCVILGKEDTRFGAVESLEESKRCAALFRENRHRIDGVVVTLPNFGDERAIANALRWSELKVPVLMQATPDSHGKMDIKFRRDSFCGKMSACNNLRQYGIAYSLTRLHTVDPNSEDFQDDLKWFGAVCRVTRGLHNLRVGAIGARPAAFNTVRYSEKMLEAHGISVETVDLAEIIGRINRTKDEEEGVQAKLAAIRGYVSVKGVPEHALMKMSKLGYVMDSWMKENDCSISAVQCWTAMEEFFGVVPCTVMSMASNNLFSSACETDICGTIGMHALAQASQTPSALLDWNNNYGEDPDMAVCFHCSNLPKHFFVDFTMDYQEIIAGAVGKENSYGTVVGRVKSGAMSYVRLSTDDLTGKIRGYCGEGEFTDDPLDTFGGAGVVRIPQLQKLLRYICENGFEHHTAANFSRSASAVHEAMTRYHGWDIYWHEPTERAPAAPAAVRRVPAAKPEREPALA